MDQRFKKAVIYASIFILIMTTGLILYAGIWLRQENPSPTKRSDDGDIVIEDEEEESIPEVLEPIPEEGEGETYMDTSPEAEVEQGSLKERLSAIEGLSLAGDTGYIFVGDSRFVHMNDVCKISDVDNLFMVAKVGQGYSWFSNTAMQQVKRIISTGLFPKWKIVVCLGVNDLGGLSQYVKKYQELKDDYDISLVSVNPVTSYGNLDNNQIDRFNSGIKELGLPYIDTSRLLMVTGFTTTDGLHYNAETSEKIFKGILLGLQDENPSCLVNSMGSILDKNRLAQKKSLQREILAQNKYVPPAKPATESSTKSSSSNETEKKTEEIVEAGEEEPELIETQKLKEMDIPVGEDGQIDQEYLDALYGIKRDKELPEDEEAQKEKESQEAQEAEEEQTEEE